MPELQADAPTGVKWRIEKLFPLFTFSPSPTPTNQPKSAWFDFNGSEPEWTKSHSQADIYRLYPGIVGRGARVGWSTWASNITVMSSLDLLNNVTNVYSVNSVRDIFNCPIYEIVKSAHCTLHIAWKVLRGSSDFLKNPYFGTGYWRISFFFAKAIP